jgi:dCMP deaminase
MDATDFGELAYFLAARSTCLRRRYGAVIVDPVSKHIISTGINGSPTGKEHCTDKQWCLREELNIPPGSDYLLCTSIHAEANAIIRAGMRDTTGSYLYIAGFEVKTSLPVVKPTPCFQCTKMIINAHISKVFLYNKRNVIEVDIDLLYDQYVQDLFNRGKQE